jgi:hypothetical protein
MIVARHIMLYATTAINKKDGSLDKTWSHRHNQSDLGSTWNNTSDVITFLYATIKLHYCIFYSSPKIIRLIKSRRMRWVRHMAHIGEIYTKHWTKKLKYRDNFEDLGIYWNMLLKWNGSSVNEST